MTSPRKNVSNTRGKPFAPGNPGKPKGSRHKTTLAVEALLEGQAELLTQAAIGKALEGDTTALRLCLDRIAPPRKGRPVAFSLPAIATANDTLAALGAVLNAVADGVLTTDEAAGIGSLLEAHRRAVETINLESRIAALEGKSHDQ